RAAQHLVAPRLHDARDTAARRRRGATSGIEINFVEVALDVAEVSAERHSAELPRQEAVARPHRRTAPVVARNLGSEARVFRVAKRRRTNGARSLILELSAVPGAHVQHAASEALIVDSEIEVALIPVVEGERRAEAARVAEQ